VARISPTPRRANSGEETIDRQPHISLEQIQNLKTNLDVFNPKRPGVLKRPEMLEQVADYFFRWLPALIHDAEYAHAEWPTEDKQ